MFQHTVMAVRSTNLSSVSLDAEKKTTTKKTQKSQQFSLVLSVYLIPLQVSTCLQCPPHPDQTDVPKGNNIFSYFCLHAFNVCLSSPYHNSFVFPNLSIFMMKTPF